MTTVEWLTNVLAGSNATRCTGGKVVWISVVPFEPVCKAGHVVSRDEPGLLDSRYKDVNGDHCRERGWLLGCCTVCVRL